MSGIDDAREFLVMAQAEADRILALARQQLGVAIAEAREKGVPQKEIAEHLGLTREQVRRLTVAVRDINPKALSDEVRELRNAMVHGSSRDSVARNAAPPAS
ncbi:hypothetical protein GCM10009530_63420 [Microbispora corallina]|uniref:Uncharacterized protein n=1 Tax=Microbispora corallina TaxID=83302 RepID=A0ABQ4GBJ1_9ACTN|nr:sigma factor-like helix-turn-helix DNA-binding protein [Microbispora corallina]GIH44428.1 hypothetical protein Mco01_74280 [Microbispora corallina]